MQLLAVYRGVYGERLGWWLEFTYNFDKIQELKQFVPHADEKGQARAWCEERGDNGEWWVAEEHIEKLLKIWPALRAHMEAKRLPGL